MADNEVLEELHSRIGELEMTIDEILDEAAPRIKMKREYKRHKDILEGIIVEAFGLSGVQSLRVNHKASDTKSMSVGRMSADNPVRMAVLTAYYILWQHNIYATRNQLELDYGYKARWFQNIFPQLEITHHYRIKRMDIERRFLDAIGRPDEPVTELGHQSIVRAAWYKRSCRAKGLEYRRSHTN